MATITDAGRFGSAGGTPTRSYRFENPRRNNSEIDILHIDDRNARKSLDEFFKHAKGQVKSFREEINKLGSETTNNIEKEKKSLDDLWNAREREHRREVSRIEYEYNERVKKAKRSTEELRKLEKKRTDDLKAENERIERERIKSLKNRYELEKKYISEAREQTKILDKYEGTEIGGKLASIFDDINIKKGKLNGLELSITSSTDESTLVDLANQAADLSDEIANLKKSADDIIDAVEEDGRRREEEGRRSEERYKKRSDDVKAAVKTFLHSVVTILTHNLTDGIQKYFNKYEDTFTDFAGRMQTSYGDTRQFYHDIRSTMYEQGMQTALNLSDDLIPAVQAAIQRGFLGNDAIAKGMADAQAKIIMPWLDTQTDAWVNLSFNMSKQNLNLMKSQQLQLQTTKAGNRLLESGVVNSLTSEMEPLLRGIEYNTGANMLDGNAEALAYMQQLVDRGWTEQEAYRETLKIVNNMAHPWEGINSDKAADVIRSAVAASGGDFSDMVEATSSLTEMMSKSDPLGIGAMSQAFGYEFSADTQANAKILHEAGLNLDSAAKDIKRSSGKYEKASDNINEYVTATQGFQNRQQNLASQVGEWITAIPEGDKWFTAVLDLLKGLIAAVVGGSLIDKLVDSIGGGEGLFSKGLGSKLLSGGKHLWSGIKTIGGKLLTGIKTLGGGSLGWGLAGAATIAGGTIIAIDSGKKMAKEISNANDPRNSTKEKQIARDAATGYGISAGLGAAGALTGVATASLGFGPPGWIAAGVLVVAAGIVSLITGANKEAAKIRKTVQEVNNAYERHIEIMNESNEEGKELLRDIRDEFNAAATPEEKENILIKEGVIGENERGKLSVFDMEERLDKFVNYAEKTAESSIALFDSTRGRVKDIVDQNSEYNEGIILRDIQNSEDYKSYKRTGSMGQGLKSRLKTAGYDISSLGKFHADDPLGWGLWGHNVTLDEILEKGPDATSLNYSEYERLYGTQGMKWTSPDTDLIGEVSEAVARVIAYDYHNMNPSPAQEVAFHNDLKFLGENRDLLKDIGLAGKLEDHIDKVGMSRSDRSWYYTDGNYAVGSPYVTRDRNAMVHKGERILTSRENDSFEAIGSTGLLLMGNNLISKLIGSNWNQNNIEDNDISRESMTDTIVNGLTKIKDAIVELSNKNGINYNTRTLPRVTNDYNDSYVNLSPSPFVSV